ncbi:MAG: PAS domain S-box protein [Propionivibrio sp.]|nr:PAS domain S-box protein [Propionivibrio sp.]
MNPPDEKQTNAALLRNEAEADLARRPLADATARPVEDLLHELQVHQIELEMQNEALRVAQTALEESRDRYVDLYEFAPVGYLTLDAEGLIEQLNLTAATLLGMERKKLLLRGFLARVLAEDHPRWTALFMRLKAGADKNSVELSLQRGDGTVFQALLDCERRPGPGVGAGETTIRIALTDISRRKVAEAAQRQQTEELTRLNRAMVGREMAMIELKRQVNALSRELGRAEPFNLDFAAAPGADATMPTAARRA